MYIKKTLAGLLAGLALSVGAAQAEEEQLTREQIAEMVNNPLSYLWMLATQNDTYFKEGDLQDADKMTVNRFTVMPVMPMQLTDNYKLVFRPWFPFYSNKLPTEPVRFLADRGSDAETKSGLGDIGFWAAIASNEGAKPPFVYGFGITTMFDTAVSPKFGTGRNCAGPMGLAFYVGEKWIFGALVQHWWDYSGGGHSKTFLLPNGEEMTVQSGHVNLTDVQYVLRYRLTNETNIGMGPNASYNWETDDFLLPVGGGMDTMIHIGKLPVKVGAEFYYYVAHGSNDAFHNEWQARVFFVPILPSPKWSRKPLF